MKTINSIANLSEYVQTFSNDLATKVASQCSPVYDPEKEPLHPRLSEIKTKPFPMQAKVITASAQALKETGLVINAGMMGTGKSMSAISTTHCLFDGKPYRVLVMCPSHLTKKWVGEVHKFLGGAVQATVIEDWRQFTAIPSTPPTHPEWYIIAQTTAKLGYARRCASVTRRRKVKCDTGGFVWTECECCSICNYPVYNRGVLTGRGTIEKLQLKCKGMRCKTCGKTHHHDLKECPTCPDSEQLRPCGEPLTQAHGHKIAPCQFSKAKRFRAFDMFIRDEAHLSKSADSIDGYACAVFASLAKYRILLTGTLLAGKSEDLRPMLFRLVPRPFINLGYGWDSEIPFAETYGRIQTVIRSSSGGYEDEKKKQGKGSTKSTSRDVKPGIMPSLFPHFVANYTVFMSLSDLATDLPSYTEEAISVPMGPMMQTIYTKMQEKLLAKFREYYVRDRRAAAKMLGPMLETLMTWPDIPANRKPVVIDNSVVLIPPDLDLTDTFPKETKLLEILKEERANKRKCWVFSNRDDVQERLKNVLESHGFKVAHMTAAVKPATRIEWLERYGPTCDIGLCNARLVETGMELFGPGYNFPTLIHY